MLAKHSCTELKEWKDHDLEQLGRLTHPMRYDRATDKYVPCEWQEAFDHIGRELKAIDPGAAIFYASGRASLETSYLYALFARLYGHNNLPDSSNMCHETTSVGLKTGHRLAGRHLRARRLSRSATRSSSSARIRARTAPACSIPCRKR